MKLYEPLAPYIIQHMSRTIRRVCANKCKRKISKSAVFFKSYYIEKNQCSYAIENTGMQERIVQRHLV